MGRNHRRSTYLKELSNLKEVLQFTLVFSPRLQSGQLVVVYQLDRVRIDFKLFRLVQVQHHTHPRWQTQVTALENHTGRCAPPMAHGIPRQLLRFNQNLNLDLNSYRRRHATDTDSSIRAAKRIQHQ